MPVRWVARCGRGYGVTYRPSCTTVTGSESAWRGGDLSAAPHASAVAAVFVLAHDVEGAEAHLDITGDRWPLAAAESMGSGVDRAAGTRTCQQPGRLAARALAAGTCLRGGRDGPGLWA